MTAITIRPLYEIAEEIYAAFGEIGKPVPPHAKPYIAAMLSLDEITDKYGLDSAKSIVIYALSNLSGWRGETARVIKAELKAMVK